MRFVRGAHAPAAMARRINTVRLKNMLSDIQPDYANFRHGRLPQVVFNTSTLAHRYRRGASTPSPIADIGVSVRLGGSPVCSARQRAKGRLPWRI